MDHRCSLITLFMINFFRTEIVFLVVSFFCVLQSDSVHFKSGFCKSEWAWRSLVCTQPQWQRWLWQHWIAVEEGYFGVMAVQGWWNNTAARACGGAARTPFCGHRACSGPSGLQRLECTSASHWSWTGSVLAASKHFPPALVPCCVHLGISAGSLIPWAQCGVNSLQGLNGDWCRLLKGGKGQALSEQMNLCSSPLLRRDPSLPFCLLWVSKARCILVNTLY